MHAFRHVCMHDCIKNMLLATLIMATFEGVVQKNQQQGWFNFFLNCCYEIDNTVEKLCMALAFIPMEGNG